MRAWLTLILTLACLTSGALTARAALSGSDQTAIQGVISSQIDAFRHDNAPGAFSFAAPAIQSMFGSPDRFIDMVRRGYPPVYRPNAIDFGALTEEDGTVVQFVDLTGPDGLGYTARYSMEQEPDGTWRISGCQLLERPKLGV